MAISIFTVNNSPGSFIQQLFTEHFYIPFFGIGMKTDLFQFNQYVSTIL